MTPETALKQSDQFCGEGDFEKALKVLEGALQNRRNKGNNAMLERLMQTLIDISVANNQASKIRDNISHFRNLCQHNSMNLLESVFNYLIKKINQLVKSVEAEHGTEKLIYLLSESEKTG